MSCATLLAEGKYSELAPGIFILSTTRSEPRPLNIYVAKINLATKGLRFKVTPGNGDPNGDEPGDPNHETTRQTTLQYLKEKKALLAVNASFFGTKEANADNVGLVVSQGERISPFYQEWPAFNLDSKNNVSLIRGKHDTFETLKPNQHVELHNAISGSDQIVTDAKVTIQKREFSTSLHPRTAIGFTRERWLIIVIVDGRQPGISEGMNLAELAKLMLELGCIQAINLDGGGSSTMAIANPQPHVVNVPSSKNSKGEYGELRKNGTNLAVFVAE